MILPKYIAIASLKGGVGKTTTAIHAAYWFSIHGWRTVLIDSDSNRTGLKWEARSKENSKFELPFIVSSFQKMAKVAGDAQIIILDTAASIPDDDLKDLAEDCDLIVIPTKTDIDSATAATETADKTIKFGGSYKILITDSPSIGSTGTELFSDLSEGGYQVFDRLIRRGEGVRHASLAGVTLAQQHGTYRRPWEDYEIAFKEIVSLLDL